MTNTPDGLVSTVIGISFGNSYSSIGFTNKEGKTDVIANQDGDRQIPSVIAYQGGQEFHGAEAKAQLIRNPRNTIANFRDFLGLSFDEIDATASHNSAHAVNRDGHPVYTIRRGEDDDETTFTVNEIVRRHLVRLKEAAEDFLGRPVTGAVLTVPTDFGSEQRKALSEAATLANLNVVQIIHEPIAAILAYSTISSEQDRIILVADFGGIRSDAAVVSARGGVYTILAAAHDLELGGFQLDEAIAEYLAKEFQKKTKVDVTKDPRSMTKLRLEAENIKKTLSSSTSTSIGIDSLCEGLDFHGSINRLRLELLGKKIFDQMMRLIGSVIIKASLDVLDVGEVILKGGQSQTPKIASKVGGLMSDKTVIQAPSLINNALNPSELASRGAALQGSIIPKSDRSDVEQSIHPAVTVNPHLSKPIGVVLENDHFHTVIEADTVLPAKRTISIDGPKNGGNVLVRFAEGRREISTHVHVKKPNGVDAEHDSSDFEESDDESAEVREVNLVVDNVLAECVVKGVKPKSRIELSVNVDADLKTTITAREVGGAGGVRGEIVASS